MTRRTNRTSRTRAPLAQALSVAAVAGSCTGMAAPAMGQASYNVSHRFNIRTNGNVAPLVVHEYYIDTNARTDRVRDNPAPEKGSHAIPAGAHLDAQSAGPVPSIADANSRANITTLVPGNAAGTITVDGLAHAILGQRSAYAYSKAYSKVYVRGQKADRRGNIRFSGGWKSTKPVVGGARSRRRVVMDPIVARLTDNTTGIVQEWTLLKTESQTLGGEFEWANDELTTDATDLIFTLEVPGDITPQSGAIRIRVEQGEVTESTATGMFAGAGVPAVGSQTGFTVPLPNEIELDYDMGGDPAHDLVPEIGMDNAADEQDAKAAWDNGGLTTSLASGYDLANVSIPQAPHVTMGVPVTPGLMHVGDDFHVEPSSGPVLLDMLDLPLVQFGGPDPLPVDAVFVRLWQGHPGRGGFPIAGDMSTNRLEEVRNVHTYRVAPSEPLETNDRPIVEAEVDMSWAPPLEAGQYWLELAAVGPGEVFTIPAVNRDGQENAMCYFQPGNQWQPLIDPGSGEPMDLSWRLHFVDDAPCYADCDGSGELDIFDFLCFQDAFSAGDPYADCDGNGIFDIFDFLCFQDAFSAGCP